MTDGKAPMSPPQFISQGFSRSLRILRNTFFAIIHKLFLDFIYSRISYLILNKPRK